MKLLLSLVFALIPAFGAELVGLYRATKETTLAGAAETVTVQQPASSSRNVEMDFALLWCSVDCVFTLKRTGTAASSTSLTPVAVNSFFPSPVTTAWHTSNVGSGTEIEVYRFKQGAAPLVIGLSGMRLSRNVTTENVSVSTDSITGVARISIYFKEYR
jgi:hypothetical protein